MMKLFWAQEGEVVACENRFYERGLVNFATIKTSNWSTKCIEVPFNGSLWYFTTGSDVIMRLYEQDVYPPSRKIVVERIAHMR